jgi:two-component system LytT family response regulator
MSDIRGLRVLLVDDEAPGRARLREAVDTIGEIASVEEAANGLAAVDAMAHRPFDLVFLDVQMPGLDGWGVIEAVGPDAMPLTVFVTAYDQYAVQAFEAHALDYVLKPYSDERIAKAVARAHHMLSLRGAQRGDGMRRMLESHQAAVPLERLAIKDAERTRLIRVEQIDCIETAGVYVVLHVGQERLVHRVALTDLLTRLDPRRFVRVHRSAVVNLDSIEHLEPLSHGEFVVVLRNGSRIRASRTYRSAIEDTFR